MPRPRRSTSPTRSAPPSARPSARAGSAPSSRTRPFLIHEYVRWGDLDLAGIIFYGAYIRFYEMAETEFFRAVGLPFREMFERFDIWLPRKVMHTEFFSPARLDEELTVITYVSHLGRTSLTINYDVVSRDGATLHAAAHQVLVCVSRPTFEKQPIPEEVRKALAPYVMSSEEARAGAR
ncbi:MAG TPA: thioesterase family protein [Gemmatimonadaceae bacterium]|nr:thioesterase family protein [Gemmatimonadaceae bacterium]